MVGLGETTSILARLRRQGVAKAPSSRTRGFLKDVADFGDNQGELRMRVYAPPGLTAGRALVVVLHGCAQTAEHYAEGAGWIDLADRIGFGLLCPEQQASNNANRCFNWFEPGDTRRGQGEAASIRAMIDTAVARFQTDPRQVFVTGLSAGGAMASVMVATNPEVFAGAGIIAGLPYGVAAGVPQAFAAMYQDRSETAEDLGRRVLQASDHSGPWPRISVWHGAADATVKSSNADAIVRQWLDLQGLDAALALSNGPGHEIWTREGVALVEKRLIPGMGHGTPVSTQGPDGLGRSGPFLLEAGVSSSLELAKFWGLAPVADDAVAPTKPNSAEPQPTPAAAGPWGARHSEQQPSRLKGKDADANGIEDTIKRALRAAGLLK
jgi:poly(hydroxyalkanoate) depolymerase family esterase